MELQLALEQTEIWKRACEEKDAKIKKLKQKLKNQELQRDPNYAEPVLLQRIRSFFVHDVDTRNVLHLIHADDPNILVEQDIQEVKCITEHHGTIRGAEELLNRLVRYRGWLSCIVNVLEDCKVKQRHVADKIRTVVETLENDTFAVELKILREKKYRAHTEMLQTSIENLKVEIQNNAEKYETEKQKLEAQIQYLTKEQKKTLENNASAVELLQKSIENLKVEKKHNETEKQNLEAQIQYLTKEIKKWGKEVQFNDIVLKFARTFFSKDLQLIEKNVKRLGADMYWETNRPICYLSGLKDGVDRGENELKKLRSRITVSTKTLCYPCAEEFLRSAAGAEEIRKIEEKHSCIITVGSSSDDCEQEEAFEPPAGAQAQRDVSEKAVVNFCHDIEGPYFEEAMTEVFEQCSKRFKQHAQMSSNVKYFSTEQIRALVEKGKKHLFKVQVNRDIGRVKISGFGDVSTIHKKIAKIEAEVEKMKMAELVDSMNTETRWQYKREGSFKDFGNLANCHLEADYKKNKTESQVKIDNEEYTVNFTQKIATSTIDGNSFEVRRENRWDSGEPLPTHWDPMIQSENLKVVDLDPQSKDYQDVEQHFKKNGARGTIVKIQRVQNRGLYQQYVAKKREIESRNPGHENEMKLFHGSDCHAINAINQTGFNRSYCGKNATLYGLGVYFTESAAYAELYATPDANNKRKLYQASVLVGMAVETDRNTKYLPPQPGKNVPFDSGKAPSCRKEGIHIIFHDSQAYPEFLITFTLPAP